ncbi:MAG: M48 family metalloprotease [Sedimenticola sp.]|nr:M48 family metalloprotease [Sedimenticola sp.]
MAALRFSVMALLVVLLGGCNSLPVRSLTSASDATAANDEEGRVWVAAEDFDLALERQDALYPDSKLQAYVQSVGDRLFPEFRGVVRYQVLDSPDLNAFALGNGSIYINSGMLARLDNEAQLATILAHEVTHFKEQHNLKNRRNINTSATAGLGITLLTGIPLSGQLFVSAAISGYSQELEREADVSGHARLVANGYAPEESVKTFEHLLAEVEALDIDQPYFFSTHPRLEERIASFRELNEKVRDAGDEVGAGRYLANTRKLRGEMLQRYLEMHQDRILILMLEGDVDHQRYPAHWPFFLGEAYRHRGEEGDPGRAAKAYRQALANAPEFAPTYRALGILQLGQERQGEALHSFQRYLELSPDAKDRGYVAQYIETIQEKDE